MSTSQLVIGMPAGSLADPRRGGSLVDVLKQAGFPAQGYDQGGPTSFPLASFVLGWDGRPQEFGSQLAIGEVDIAISGTDWVRERTLELKYEFGQELNVQKVLSLKRGGVRLVIINADDTGASCNDWFTALLKEKALVTMVSEMPYIALEWFKEKIVELGFGESHAEYSVQKYKTPPRIDTGLVIYETWGKTEAKIKRGAVDFGLEITQTGSAIRNYGLNIVAEVMRSEACVWAHPHVKEDPEKYELARMFLLNMYGAVFAEDKVLLLFNAKNEDEDVLRKYLQDNFLFEKEPTMNRGINYIEYSVQVDVKSPELPLARVRYDLAKLGATGIETIPLESSIPGLDAIDF